MNLKRKNEFSTLPEDTNLCKNRSVIPKSDYRLLMAVNYHSEKQTLYEKSKQTKKDKAIIFGDSIPKSIWHREFNHMVKSSSAISIIAR